MLHRWLSRKTGRLPGIRRRWQFRMATLLALPAVAALGLVWSGFGRPKPNSYEGVLYRNLRWAADPFDDFDRWGGSSVPCFLKVAYQSTDPRPYDAKTHPFPENHMYGMWSFSDEGEICYRWSNGTRIAGECRSLPAGAAAALRPVLANMSPSDQGIPDGKSVAIGFRGSRGWETRVYDRRTLPAPLVKALAGAWIILPP